MRNIDRIAELKIASWDLMRLLKQSQAKVQEAHLEILELEKLDPTADYVPKDN